MVVRTKTFVTTGDPYNLEVLINAFLATLVSTDILDVVMRPASITPQGMRWFGYVVYRE